MSVMPMVAVLVASAVGLGPRLVSAAAPDGQYAIKGEGRQTCEHLLAGGSAQFHAGFRGWIMGYLTAVNRYEATTYDIIPWQGIDVLITIINNHCKENKGERLNDVVHKIVMTFQPSRLEHTSSGLVITVDGQSVRIYEDVLLRAQEKLADLGFYAGVVDAKFGPATQEAFATFQLTEELEATGLPDTLTLWKLFSPKGS